MAEIFRAWIGGEASMDGSTITFSLEGDGGREHRFTLAFELAEELAHNLMELKAQALHRQDQGVQTESAAGEIARVSTLPLSAFEVDRASHGKLVLRLWTMRDAQYVFSLPADAAPALVSRLSQT